MAKRVPASMRTRESLSDLIEGRLSSAAGRGSNGGLCLRRLGLELAAGANAVRSTGIGWRHFSCGLRRPRMRGTP